MLLKFLFLVVSDDCNTVCLSAHYSVLSYICWCVHQSICWSVPSFWAAAPIGSPVEWEINHLVCPSIYLTICLSVGLSVHLSLG